MSSGFHPGSFRPVSGLAGVRAISGLGLTCGCQARTPNAVDGVVDFVKSPLGFGLAALLLVGSIVVIREVWR